MIITQLSGGLGNQMFQYTLGRVLSYKNDDELLFDLSSFTDQKNGDTHRQYELAVYGVKPYECSTHDKIRLGDENPFIKMINRFFKTNIDPDPSTLVREKGHYFHPEIIDKRGDIYLRGFWQTEKYFIDYRHIILKDFTFKKELNLKSLALLEQIQKNDSVSIHVRRGDYVSNHNANKYHGTCSVTYYQKAVKIILKTVAKPSFFVFSDDTKWCQENLKLDGRVVYISHNLGNSSWQDMFLMSQCKHNIIANSSFSWWAAWLNQNPSKIVIAPRKWLADSKSMLPDLLPTDWIKI